MKDMIRLKDMSDRDLLVQVATTVGDMKDEWKEFTSGPGAARCQLHSLNIDEMKNGIKWTKRTVLGGVITVIFSVIHSLFFRQ